jgi:copper transport protein
MVRMSAYLASRWLVRRALILLAGVALGLFGLFAIPAGSAHAHAALVRTDPAQGAILPAAPSEIVITFSERVRPVVARITVIDPNGQQIGSGRPFVTGDDMHIPVRTGVPHGTFLVSYRVISADSHPVGGGYTYSVGAPSPGGAPTPADGGNTDYVVSSGVSIMQFIGFAGLIMVIGPSLVLIALWPRRIDRRAPIRVAYTGLGLIAGSALVGLYLQAPYGNGGSLLHVTGADVSDVLDSHFGQAVLVRIAITVVVAFLLRPVLSGRGGKTDQALLLGLGVLGVGTWAVAGHSGATGVAPLTVVADAAHLISVSVWIGGLFTLGAILLRKANARELNAILPVWSNWATLAVTVLVLSGTAQALIEIGTVHALIDTTYGQLVLAKIGLLAVILAFAAGARRLVQQYAGLAETDADPELALASLGAESGGGVVVTLDHDTATGRYDDATTGDAVDDDGSDGDAAPSGDDEPYEQDEPDEADEADEPPRGMDSPGVLGRLRRSVLVEFALAVAVLVATSILVQATPARTAAADATLAATAAGVITLNSPIYSLQMDTAQTGGITEIHLFAYTPGGDPLKVVEWTVTATLAAKNLGPLPAVVTPFTDSHAVGQISLTVPGQWTFAITLRVSDVDEATVTTIVTIK